MTDPFDELASAYLADRLSAGERIRFEARLASGDRAALDALERARGTFPKERVVPENKTAAPGPPPFKKPPVALPPELEKPEPAAGPVPAPDAERVFQEPDSVVRTRLTRILAGLGLLLLFYTAYLQFELVVTRQKLARTAAEPTPETAAPAADRSYIHAFELERLKAALTADQGKLIQAAADKKSAFKKAFLLVDFSTNRTVAMLSSEPLPEGMILAFWVENRDYDVNLLGTIDRIRPDSVYTTFEGSAFVHGRFLEVHLQKGQDFRSGNRIARVRLP